MNACFVICVNAVFWKFAYIPKLLHSITVTVLKGPMFAQSRFFVCSGVHLALFYKSNICNRLYII